MADKQSSEGNLKIDVDVSDALKGLKAVRKDAKKTTAALKELEEQSKKNQSLPNGLLHEIPGWIKSNPKLLQLELESLDSVPTVYYKGEKIDKKMHVAFDWKTQTDVPVFTPNIRIEYIDTDSQQPNIKTIEHNPIRSDIE